MQQIIASFFDFVNGNRLYCPLLRIDNRLVLGLKGTNTPPNARRRFFVCFL